VVLGVCLSVVCFFLFYFPFSIFFVAMEWGRSLAGSLAADRRPIDPPPIVQLRVIDKARKNLPSPSPSPPPTQHHQQPASHPHAQQHTHESSVPLDTSMLTPSGFGAGPFLQNPYYFMFASLAKPDDDTELHWMKVRFDYSSSSASPPLFTSSPRMARPDVPPDRLSRHCIT
jgi:Velvet factor